jgi:hypothetical protein
MIIRRMALLTPPGGFQGLATRAALTAHSGPRAAAHTEASPAENMCSEPRKASLRSGAAMAAIMAAHVSCGRVSQAFLAILEPEKQGWEDSGVSEVTRGQGQRPKWVDSVLKFLTSGENRARLGNYGKVVACGIVRFHLV